MKCPYCGDADTRVIDSRPAENSIRRRRQCAACGKRFTTYEKVETIPMMIVKKDSTRELYDRSKIEAGLVRPTIHAVLPIEKAEEAQDILYLGKNVGKVVLTVR